MVDHRTPASSHNQLAATKQVERLPNLAAGGVLLAEKLRDRDLSDSLVLAIARAGVPAGHEVAKQLALSFDLILIRRLLLPNGPEDALCALSVAGSTVVDEEINIPSSPSTPLEHFLVQALHELRQAENICRGDRPPIDVGGKKVILVDCGIHTGSTMKIAIRALRTLNPARVIAAVPVVSPEAYPSIETAADEFLYLARPDPFIHTGMWYEDFSRPRDEDLSNLLDRSQIIAS
jgi:putative phosphoribosyl transferase